MRGLWRNLCLAVALMAPLPAAAQVLEFESLDGWYEDDHAAALKTFLATCDLINAPTGARSANWPPTFHRTKPLRAASSSCSSSRWSWAIRPRFSPAIMSRN
ncbi:hypothetical protein MASR1M32_04650 [Rhodobacter sp.]